MTRAGKEIPEPHLKEPLTGIGDRGLSHVDVLKEESGAVKDNGR